MVNWQWVGLAWVRILVKQLTFILLHNIKTGSGYFAWVNWLGCEIDHSLLSSTSIKHEQCYITTTPRVICHGQGQLCLYLNLCY
jgi:hypothetical protein